MKAAVPERLQQDGSIRLSAADRAALGLAVSPAHEGNVPDVATRFGRARARPEDEVTVIAPFSAIVRAPLTALGVQVASGDALLELAPVFAAAERIALGVQRADVTGQIEAAERELRTQQAEAARARELARSEIVSTAKLQAAETVVATTRARLEALRKAESLQTHAGESGIYTVRAPITGRVALLDISVGALVSQGDVLTRLVRGGARWIDLSLPPDDPVGDAYEVEIAGGWEAARLVARGAVADPSGARIDRLELGRDAALLSGVVVPVRVARDSGRGIVLPETAVVAGVPLDSVYVETRPGIFVPRKVRLGARFGGVVRIAEGLQPGEQVVTQGVMGLRGEAARAELRHTE